MLARQVTRLGLHRYQGCRNSLILEQVSRSMSKYDPPEEEVQKPKPQLKQWRREWDDGSYRLQTKFKVWDRTGKVEGPTMEKVVALTQPWDLSADGIKKWWNQKKIEAEKEDQKFIKLRHEILGSNLATGHFLVFRGAKVKFLGQPGWTERDEKGNYNLPTSYVPDFVVEAIDINGMNLYYEGLDNMRFLNELKWLSLKGCKTIDDWCLDKMSSYYPNLEYLDISDCEKVTERGLEALYRIHSLKKLIVTNHHVSPAFELTCMMLEDCSSQLKVDMRLPAEKDSVPAEAQT
ncbi:distal membrane-arm assembly complex protein 2 [Neodiprion lecontei]|uniref:Distal membrane-arm assembly complex protein 2 n=1 Tax=Neodiprion lecontei TaxID=441921 RepID=A0A6J0BWU4_NEOLC|nr:distal membrane-arm assembly complex protein 2 [Neodiprion lecontei]